MPKLDVTRVSAGSAEFRACTLTNNPNALNANQKANQSYYLLNSLGGRATLRQQQKTSVLLVT